MIDECKDPKSKQYRDKSRAIQIKLKVSGNAYNKKNIDVILVIGPKI